MKQIPILVLGRGGSHSVDVCNTIDANYFKGLGNNEGRTGVAILPLGVDTIEEYLRIKEATKQGYVKAYEGDGVNFGASGSHTRRGRVQQGGVNTLTTQAEQGVVVFDEQNGRIKDDGTVNTLMADGSSPKHNPRVGEEVKGKLRIRKLTPRECWRLQNWCYQREDGTWDDSAFEKAKFKKSIVFFEKGGEECSAKLMVAKEKQIPTDLEICACCTIKDMFDTEMLQMMEVQSTKNVEKESLLNVNIVVGKSVDPGALECATNITKCTEFMGMPCIAIINQEAHHLTDIIVQANVGKGNIERSMKISMESGLSPSKLFTILTLLKQIIELKIFTSATLEVNIRCSMQIIESLENYTLLKISNLQMEHIEERTSDSSLYKQAGNGCSANITMVIGLRLAEIESEANNEGAR